MERYNGEIRRANLGQPGIVEDEYGDPCGADPRGMSPADLEAMGFKRTPPLRAIRAKCLQCCCGSAVEVRHCILTGCPSWPYRMGTDPWRKKVELTEEQRRAMAKRLASYRQATGV